MTDVGETKLASIKHTKRSFEMAPPRWIYVIEVYDGKDKAWSYAKQDSSSYRDALRILKSLKEKNPEETYRMHLYCKWTTINTDNKPSGK